MSIRIENTQVFGWEAAIRGARNPMNSWEKSDSWFLESQEEGAYYYHDLIPNDDYYDHCSDDPDDKEIFLERMKHNKDKAILIGPNDNKLLMNLCKGGTEEAKWRRMVHVQMDVTAPLYWWKEFETYKIGTVSNSCSTMHKIHAKEFTLEDFSCEHLFEEHPLNRDMMNAFSKDEEEKYYKNDNAFYIDRVNDEDGCGFFFKPYYSMDALEQTVMALNIYRLKFIETKDKRYWYQMIQLLPSSYNQRRTIDLNYEVLAAQYRQRKDHKLDCWRKYCDWIRGLPYSEFITIEDNDE